MDKIRRLAILITNMLGYKFLPCKIKGKYINLLTLAI